MWPFPWTGAFLCSIEFKFHTLEYVFLSWWLLSIVHGLKKSEPINCFLKDRGRAALTMRTSRRKWDGCEVKWEHLMGSQTEVLLGELHTQFFFKPKLLLKSSLIKGRLDDAVSWVSHSVSAQVLMSVLRDPAPRWAPGYGVRLRLSLPLHPLK